MKTYRLHHLSLSELFFRLDLPRSSYLEWLRKEHPYGAVFYQRLRNDGTTDGK